MDKFLISLLCFFSTGAFADQSVKLTLEGQYVPCKGYQHGGPNCGGGSAVPISVEIHLNNYGQGEYTYSLDVAYGYHFDYRVRIWTADNFPIYRLQVDVVSTVGKDPKTRTQWSDIGEIMFDHGAYINPTLLWGTTIVSGDVSERPGIIISTPNVGI
jgi:hypothetical protein